ncbi:nuclear transport factor 2 family protein [Chloroflexota bacterium]
MSEEDLMASIKTLENQVTALGNQVRNLQDIEEINTLQKAYGYYLEHWMTQEIIDCFSNGSDVALTLVGGTYLGKQSVKRYFEHNNPTSEFLHQVMQLSGIVNVDPDGKTAKGRWYGYGAMAVPRDKGVRQAFLGGIYGCEYVKEDGKWKFKKLRFDISYYASPAEGWVEPERVAVISTQEPPTIIKADIPRTFMTQYPSGYIFPFHYKHPVTGKETTEGAINSAIEGVESCKIAANNKIV